MATNNSINLNTNGIPSYNNTTGVFTGSAVTNHNVLLGAANNLITSVAPSATAGIPFVSGGAAADGSFTTAVVAGGGTGAVTLTGVLTGNGTSAFTANAITQYYTLVAGASNAVSQVAPGTAGYVLTSNGAAADPSYQVATPGSLTPYLVSAGPAQTLAANQGYITASLSSILTYTPPATCPAGTRFAIVGQSGDGWTIDLTANSQSFFFGSLTPATTSVSSTNQFDCIEFICTSDDVDFTIVNAVGNPLLI